MTDEGYRFRYCVWLFVLTCFFVAANLSDFARVGNTSTYHDAGFPFTFIQWHQGGTTFFDADLMFLDGCIVFGVSIFLPLLLAMRRDKPTV